MIYIDAAVGNGVPNLGVPATKESPSFLFPSSSFLHFHELHAWSLISKCLKVPLFGFECCHDIHTGAPSYGNYEGGVWQALIWTDVYSYAAFSCGASGLLDTMIHCMRGTVWLRLGGFLGRLAIPLFWSRSQEQGARSREPGAAVVGFFYKLFSEGYY